MKTLIEQHIQQSMASKQAILDSSNCIAAIEKVARLCQQVLAKGGKILIAGNGGSAADAQHIAAELVGRFEKERPGLAAIALTTDSSALTAIANDFGYPQVFARQLQAIGNSGDVFIGISTSGNSANIVAAAETARSAGLHTVCLTGDGGRLPMLCDLAICVPDTRTATIQECHIMIGHILCSLIEA
ncbi:MAG TPA: D-sedoheptulose 7-phosphate isomerase [Pseudomonadales bacterium]